MRVSAYLSAAVAVAMSVSPAIALAIREDQSQTLNLRDNSCSKTAIDACAALSGHDNTACFGRLCMGRPLITKRQDEDQCTEDNLLRCSILDWNEAQACFQSICGTLTNVTIIRSKYLFSEASCWPTTTEMLFGFGFGYVYV
ncbi:hypothetical protein F4808DRAFT_455347 [Astrocystis sublimbata]|nr:hypothetical protein F4808DRAFT_455347 [Astrocystis sublimbata]